jgi:hypothetical protein
MKKFVIGLIIGTVIAFPLGINFGKDAPLLSNPFATKPDLSERVKERAGDLVQDTKEVIHDATAPGRKEIDSHIKR